MGNENSSSTSKEGVKDIDTDVIIDSTIKMLDACKIQVGKDGEIKVMETETKSELKNTLIQAGKGTAILGACGFIAAVVMGPAWFVVGAIPGAYFATLKTKGTYKSLKQMFNELSSERKKKLVYEILSTAKTLGIENKEEFVKIATILFGTLSNKALILELTKLIIPIFVRYLRE
jgi:hypothetical protein